jgi:hypothetical protein
VSEKRVSEMTFQEFLQKAREKGTDFRAINDIESFILDNMQQEGFTKEQTYSMPMNRLWGLWIDAVSNSFEKEFSRIGNALEKNPNLAISFEPMFRSMTNNLEKWADELEDELNKKEKDSKSKDNDKK